MGRYNYRNSPIVRFIIIGHDDPKELYFRADVDKYLQANNLTEVRQEVKAGPMYHTIYIHVQSNN
jgi:hypothetical protein